MVSTPKGELRSVQKYLYMMKLNTVIGLWVVKNWPKVWKCDHIYAKLWINDLSFPSIRAETVFLFTIISPAPNRLLGNRNNHNNNIKVIRIAKLYRIET